MTEVNTDEIVSQVSDLFQRHPYSDKDITVWERTNIDDSPMLLRPGNFGIAEPHQIDESGLVIGGFWKRSSVYVDKIIQPRARARLMKAGLPAFSFTKVADRSLYPKRARVILPCEDALAESPPLYTKYTVYRDGVNGSLEPIDSTYDLMILAEYDNHAGGLFTLDSDQISALCGRVTSLITSIG